MSLPGVESRARQWNATTDGLSERELNAKEERYAEHAEGFLAAILAPLGMLAGCDETESILIENDSVEDSLNRQDAQTEPQCIEPPLQLTPSPNETVYKADGLTIYYDKNIGNDELYALIDSVEWAKERSDLFATKYFGIERPFDNLEIFYRPDCKPNNPYFMGAAFADQILISRCDLEPEFFKLALAKEMTSALFYPRLADDPSQIIQTGLEMCVAGALIGENDPAHDQYAVGWHKFESHLFPKEPAEPLYNFVLDENNPVQTVIDLNGDEHVIELNFIHEDSETTFTSFVVDGEETKSCLHWAGIIEDKQQLFGLTKNEKNEYVVYVYDLQDAQTRTSLDNYLELANKVDTKALIKQPLKHYIWGETDNGSTEMFHEQFPSGKPLAPSLDPAEGLINNDDMASAIVLIFGLQELYWDSHPEKHPDSFFEAFGRVHEKFIASQNEETEFTNVYQELCNELEIEDGLCIGLMEAFGLNTDISLQQDFNYCSTD